MSAALASPRVDALAIPGQTVFATLGSRSCLYFRLDLEYGLSAIVSLAQREEGWVNGNGLSNGLKLRERFLLETSLTRRSALEDASLNASLRWIF